MLLTKTTTQTAEVQVEVKTPAFFCKPDSEKRIMLCNDGSILTAYRDFISRAKVDSYGYKSTLEEVLNMPQSTQEEFDRAYKKAILLFQESMYLTNEKTTV